jgi:hypothetical protein
VRVLLALIAGLGCVALLAMGFVLGLVGFAELYADNQTYKVGFKHAGDECGKRSLWLDLDDGSPLHCGAGTPINPPDVSLPGFTQKQNQLVASLAGELGSGGLTPAEQLEIQSQVDGFAASVPEAARPDHRSIWDPNRVWLGAAMFLVGAIGLILMGRPRSSR